MTPFEALRPDLDAQVSNHLGDSISVTRRDNTTVTVLGWITYDAEALGIESLDPTRRMPHAKIDKSPTNLALLPDGPASIRRLTHSKLNGPHKPAADSIDDDGNAWIFDLQKAPA